VPEGEGEVNGQVSQVVFAEGLVQFRGKWFLYYGMADSELGARLRMCNFELWMLTCGYVRIRIKWQRTGFGRCAFENRLRCNDARLRVLLSMMPVT